MAIVSTSLQRSVLILIYLFTNNSKVLGSTDTKAASENYDLGDNDSKSCENHVTGYCAQYSSCANKCGQTVKHREIVAPNTCSCDYLCLLYKDCCLDFETQCPSEYDKINQSPLKRLVNIKAKCKGSYMALSSCVDSNFKTSSERVTNCTTSKNPLAVDVVKLNVNSSDMVSSTNNDNCEEDDDEEDDDEEDDDEEDDDEEDDDDISYDNVLVTDLQTGLTYSDKEYYQCNNPGPRNDSLMTWTKKYVHHDPFTIKELKTFLEKGTSSERFLEALTDEPPELIVPRYCPIGVEVKCNFDCKHNEKIRIENFYRICEALSGRRKPERKKDLSQTLIHELDNYGYVKTIKPSTSENVIEECVFRQHYYSSYQPSFGAIAFSALLSLGTSTKGLIKEHMSGLFPGGWDQYVCETDGNGSGCQMKFRCNEQSLYIGNVCVKPKAILLIIKSTTKDLGHASTTDFWNSFIKSLRNHTTLQYGNIEDDEVIKTDATLIHVYITLPKLIGESTRKDNHSHNRYKDVIQTTFSNIVEPHQWNGTVSTCYNGNSWQEQATLKDLVSQEVNLRREFYCEDITPFLNLAKQRNGLQEGNTADAQTRINQIIISLCFAMCVLVEVANNVVKWR